MPAPRGTPRLTVPRYRDSSLAEVLPSLLSALGVAGSTNPLGVEPVERVCLLLVDGLGWEQLLDHADDAPFLASLAPSSRPIDAVFPTSTAPSLASVATGEPPGEHGLVGYAMALPGLPAALNCIKWDLYQRGPSVDMRARAIPEQVQPLAPLLERAMFEGVEATVVGPGSFRGTGLTRAIWRGVAMDGIQSLDAGDGVPAVAEALRRGDRSIVYTYYGELDGAGHRFGPHTAEWRSQLRTVDRIAERLAAALPPRAMLVVTSDHGMVNQPRGEAHGLDLGDHPGLAGGVRLLGGDPRARHVYAREGAAEDVLASWKAELGHGMWVVSREEAIEAGWFGPRVRDEVRPRIGDVVAAAFGPLAIYERRVDPAAPMNVGHHGSLTSAERLVPFLTYRRYDQGA